MELATNAVLLAVLVQASQFVRDLELPLQLPLQQSNVTAFRLGASWSQATSDLGCYLSYKGGYVFQFNHGCIIGLSTPDSYSDLQHPADLDKMVEPARYSQAECLLKAMRAFTNLGYANVPLLHEPPVVRGPMHVRGGDVPRVIFTWPQSPGSKFSKAIVEINSSRLTVAHLHLTDSAFWRSPWPITFGTTNTLEDMLPKPTSASGNNGDLQVKGLSREYATAYLNAILPSISDFCSKLGAPFPASVGLDGISMGESEVGLYGGRVVASLRLKSGLLIVFAFGHVWAVHAPDALYTSPWRKKEVRDSKEYLEPIRLSEKQAAQKILEILSRLNLDRESLFLDTAPVFSMKPHAEATSGIRRYVIQWQNPAVDDAALERKKQGLPPEPSVSSEVDAVSGEVKTLNFFSRSLERPDPIIQIPKTTNRAALSTCGRQKSNFLSVIRPMPCQRCASWRSAAEANSLCGAAYPDGGIRSMAGVI